MSYTIGDLAGRPQLQFHHDNHHASWATASKGKDCAYGDITLWGGQAGRMPYLGLHLLEATTESVQQVMIELTPAETLALYNILKIAYKD